MDISINSGVCLQGVCTYVSKNIFTNEKSFRVVLLVVCGLFHTKGLSSTACIHHAAKWKRQKYHYFYPLKGNKESRKLIKELYFGNFEVTKFCSS